MMAPATAPERQPCLFDGLPATAPRRRRARPAATPGTEDAPPPRIVIQVAPARVDVAALSNPDLSDLVRALEAPSLAFLLIEAAREVKRRLAPADSGDEDEAECVGAPHPALPRDVRAVVADLAGED